MAFLAIYITHASKEAGQALTNKLLEDRLIACANLFPITSAYWWQGNIENEEEYVSILKTIPQNWKTLEARVIELHPYEVPCIMQFKVKANASYEAWIKAQVIQK